MNCEACRGACCEEMVLPQRQLEAAMTDADSLRWLELRGTRVAYELIPGVDVAGAGVRFECRCTELTEAGRCAIYDDRPLACAIFPPGGRACLDVVRRRRTAADYELIRDEEDPEELDGN